MPDTDSETDEAHAVSTPPAPATPPALAAPPVASAPSAPVPTLEIALRFGSAEGVPHVVLPAGGLKPTLFLVCRQELAQVTVACRYRTASAPRGPWQKLPPVTLDVCPAPQEEFLYIGRFTDSLPLAQHARALSLEFTVQEGKAASVSVTVVPRWQHLLAWSLTGGIGLLVLFLWAYLWAGVQEQDTTLAGIAKVWGTIQGLGLLTLVAATRPWARRINQSALLYRARFAAAWLLLAGSLFLPRVLAVQVYNATGSDAVVNGVDFPKDKWTLYWRWLPDLDDERTDTRLTTLAREGLEAHQPADRVMGMLVRGKTLHCKRAEWQLDQSQNGGAELTNKNEPETSCELQPGKGKNTCVTSRDDACTELPISLKRTRAGEDMYLHLAGEARRLLTHLSTQPAPSGTWTPKNSPAVTVRFLAARVPVRARVSPVNASRPDTAGRRELPWWVDWNLSKNSELALPESPEELPAVQFLFFSGKLLATIADSRWEVAPIEASGLMLDQLDRFSPHAHFKYEADSPGERAWSVIGEVDSTNEAEETAQLSYRGSGAGDRWLAFPRKHLPPHLRILNGVQLEGTLSCSAPAEWQTVYLRRLDDLSGRPAASRQLGAHAGVFVPGDSKAQVVWVCQEAVKTPEEILGAVSAPATTPGPTECGVRNSVFVTGNPDKKVCTRIWGAVKGTPSSCKTFYDCT